MRLGVKSTPKSGKFTTIGQAASVRALWRENFATSDLPPPPVFTLEDRADLSPESVISHYARSLDLNFDSRAPFQSSKSVRKWLLYKDLATPVCAKKSSGNLTPAGQAASVRALRGDNFAYSGPRSPPVFTLEDCADFSPESGISLSLDLKYDPRTPSQRSGRESTASKSKSDVSISYALMAEDHSQRTPAASSSCWSPTKRFYPTDPNLPCEVYDQDTFYGTTLCALKYKDGIVIGSDCRTVRTSDGWIVNDTQTKIFCLLKKRVFMCLAGSVVKGYEFRIQLQEKLKAEAGWWKDTLSPTSEAATWAYQIMDKLKEEEGRLSAIIGGLDRDKSTKLYTVKLNTPIEDQDFVGAGNAATVLKYLKEKVVSTEIIDQAQAKNLVFDAMLEAVRKHWASGGDMNFFSLKTDGEGQRETAKIEPREEDERVTAIPTTFPPKAVVIPKKEDYSWFDLSFEPAKLDDDRVFIPGGVLHLKRLRHLKNL